MNPLELLSPERLQDLCHQEEKALIAAYEEHLAQVMRGLMRSSGEVHHEWLKEWERLHQRFAGVYAAVEHQKKTPSLLSGPR